MKKIIKGKQRGMTGRKPVEDKKIQVCLYVRQSIIDKFGGKEHIIESIYESLN